MSNRPDCIKCFVCFFQVIPKVLPIILLKNIKQLTTLIISIVRANFFTCGTFNSLNIFLVNYLQSETYRELVFFEMVVKLLVVLTTALVNKLDETFIHPKHCCPLNRLFQHFCRLTLNKISICGATSTFY
jgi:hypothetical protein